MIKAENKTLGLSEPIECGIQTKRFNSELHDESRLGKALSSSPQFRSFLDDCFIQKKIHTSNSLDMSDCDHYIISQDECKVLVLYTGGTIGMVRNEDGVLIPKPQAFEQQIRKTCTLHDQEYSRARFSKHYSKRRTSDPEQPQVDDESVLLPLVLPLVPDHRRVVYTIFEYDPLLDSSNMTMDDWIQIAKDIERSYELFDGFVILHGTDTLAYTASALSFMLENLGKPVILTGSQIPSFETRSDGRDNLVGALILAGNYNIPEVTVYFRHRLLRGNRTVKMSCENLDAFDSPNMPPLVKAGINFEIDYKAINRPKEIAKFRVHSTLNRNVVLLRLFPSIRLDTVAHFLAHPIEGVVLQCYGSGNVPTMRPDFLDKMQEATNRGVLILCVTQCSHGGVSSLYATGKALIDRGVILGCNITPEAALTKLSYVLSKTEWDLSTKRHMMQSNLAGEMTMVPFKAAAGAGEARGIISLLAEALRLRTSEEQEGLADMLFPTLMCAAAASGGMEKLEALMDQGGDPTLCDHELRTPLHSAAAAGHHAMVAYLMTKGACVHARDKYDQTPLTLAIEAQHPDIVKDLVRCGAHLHVSGVDLAEQLCRTVRSGNIQKLSCYALAGADLAADNRVKQTPLHVAVECDQPKMVAFILQHTGRSCLSKRDLYNRTPLDVARILGRAHLVSLLQAF